MKMKRVLAVVGTRPEAIKMFPLIAELKKREGIVCRVLSTGQHGEMLDSALAEFGIVPDIRFVTMREGQTLNGLSARLLQKLPEVLREEAPSVVLVHGDTTTAAISALAAFNEQIPVAHVEAGLRTGDMKSPFPEEFNRRLISLAASLHFAPTVRAAEELLREGIASERIFVTGNTVHDTLGYTVRDDYWSARLEWARGSRLLLLTAHRRESRGARMREALLGIRDVILSRKGVKVIFPVHPSPSASAVAFEVFRDCESVMLTEPLSTTEFHNLIARSYLVITDSGGVQEEAPSLSVPVLLIRDKTERTEELTSGAVIIGGTDRRTVSDTLSELLDGGSAYDAAKRAKSRAIRGAARSIADIIVKYTVG